jgi:phenylpropionate dioxygenase-like ring-hydroxylating dioxygenase large terminal subunit
MTWTSDQIATLVTPGRVDRRVYTDPELFELELERVYYRSWIFLGHESQAKKPGDFFTTRIARHRLIVVRHTDGKLYAFYNRCSHRGAEVCAEPAGNVRKFTCPYHAWSYGTDGRVIGIPLIEAYEGLRPRREDFRLEQIQQLDSYRGFIFGSLRPTALGLRESIGDSTLVAFDNMIDRAPDGEIEIAGGRTIQRYQANWKFQIENSIDLLHPRILHNNVVEAIGGDVPTDPDGMPAPDIDFLSGNGISFKAWNDIQLEALPGGHCSMGSFLRKKDPTESLAADDRLAFIGQDRYRSDLVARHGLEKAKEVLGFNRHNTIIYPNLFINPRLQQIRYLVPTAVDRTEQHGFVFRYKGAPEEMFHVAIRILNAANSPASLVTTDDHEVFDRMQETLTNGDLPWVDWSRGLHTERAKEFGRIAEGTNEMPMRNQFREWVRLMRADA